ncbi:hypothetical protein Dimus_012131 [Dionaea muscipula]
MLGVQNTSMAIGKQWGEVLLVEFYSGERGSIDDGRIQILTETMAPFNFIFKLLVEGREFDCRVVEDWSVSMLETQACQDSSSTYGAGHAREFDWSIGLRMEVGVAIAESGDLNRPPGTVDLSLSADGDKMGGMSSVLKPGSDVPLTKMIPSKYLSKLSKLSKQGLYSIAIDSRPIKVYVADRVDVIDRHVNDMRNIAAKSNPSVVGLDFKRHTFQYYQILVLCGSDRCLIVQLNNLDRFPESLIGFLTDPNVCHVGKAINSTNCGKLEPELFSASVKLTQAGVDVGDLASRVFRKPRLRSALLAEIAREAGVFIASLEDSMEGTKLAAINLRAKLFSSEEVKIIATDAFRYYRIGHELMSILEAL